MNSARNGTGQPIEPKVRECVKSTDGRIWWIDEAHPNTNARYAVCRAVERGFLTHTAIWARAELSPL